MELARNCRCRYGPRSGLVGHTFATQQEVAERDDTSARGEPAKGQVPPNGCTGSARRRSPQIELGCRVPMPLLWADSVQMSYLDLVAVIVADYDEAITFFVDVLDFDLVDDEPSLSNDGRPKRWVVVRPKGGSTSLLLAQADGELQREAIGTQFAGRVGLFLRVDDFDQTYRRLVSAGVEFVTEPRSEPYGKVAVFVDLAGNRWDLLSQT